MQVLVRGGHRQDCLDPGASDSPFPPSTPGVATGVRDAGTRLPA